MTFAFTSEHSFPLPRVVNHSASSQPLSAHQLTCRMRDGSDEAWDEFHRRYYIPLLRHAGCCSSAPDDASDIVQKAYLRIARHIKPFRDETEFWRWLICVVRCTAVDHQRGVIRRAALLEKFAHWQESQQQNNTHSRMPGHVGITDDALASFTDEEAQLLRLKYCEGWSVEQLAERTSTTPKAIENRLARLRQRLRDIIAKIQ